MKSPSPRFCSYLYGCKARVILPDLVEKLHLLCLRYQDQEYAQMFPVVLQLMVHRGTPMDKTECLERKLGSDLICTAKASLIFRSIFRCSLSPLPSGFRGWGVFSYYLNVSCSLLPSLAVDFAFFILCPSVSPRVQFNHPEFSFQAGCVVFWVFASSHTVSLLVPSVLPNKQQNAAGGQGGKPVGCFSLGSSLRCCPVMEQQL